MVTYLISNKTKKESGSSLFYYTALLIPLMAVHPYFGYFWSLWLPISLYTGQKEYKVYIEP